MWKIQSKNENFHENYLKECILEIIEKIIYTLYKALKRGYE